VKAMIVSLRQSYARQRMVGCRRFLEAIISSCGAQELPAEVREQRSI